MSKERYKFLPGEFFVYSNGLSWELGKVKRAADEEGTAYFCWYSSGTTVARTPVERMHWLINGNTGPQCHITVNDCLAHMDPSDHILIRNCLVDDELYRGIADSTPLELWHLPIESCHILEDGCRLVEVS